MFWSTAFPSSPRTSSPQQMTQSREETNKQITNSKEEKQRDSRAKSCVSSNLTDHSETSLLEWWYLAAANNYIVFIPCEIVNLPPPHSGVEYVRVLAVHQG